jgi:EAL domain-containing protein (putative c-di-GMP-specific phosphodiesterase class I)
VSALYRRTPDIRGVTRSQIINHLAHTMYARTDRPPVALSNVTRRIISRGSWANCAPSLCRHRSHASPFLAWPGLAWPGLAVETLVRWQQPPGGPLIFPEEFLPLAERCGLLTDSTESVLASAMQQARAWRQCGETFGVAVNVPMRYLAAPDFPDMAASLADSTRPRSRWRSPKAR